MRNNQDITIRVCKCFMKVFLFCIGYDQRKYVFALNLSSRKYIWGEVFKTGRISFPEDDFNKAV